MVRYCENQCFMLRIIENPNLTDYAKIVKSARLFFQLRTFKFCQQICHNLNFAVLALASSLVFDYPLYDKDNRKNYESKYRLIIYFTFVILGTTNIRKLTYILTILVLSTSSIGLWVVMEQELGKIGWLQIKPE